MLIPLLLAIFCGIGVENKSVAAADTLIMLYSITPLFPKKYACILNDFLILLSRE